MQRAGSATRAYVAAAVAAGLVVVMLFLHSHATSDLGRAERSRRAPVGGAAAGCETRGKRAPSPPPPHR